MKRERKKITDKKNVKTTSKKQPVKKSIDLPKSSFLNKIPLDLWVLIIMICVIALISFFNFFSLEFLFYFTDIGSDTINQNYPNDIHKFNILSEDRGTRWSFYMGMGSQYIETIPTDPLILLQKGIFYVGSSLFGADFLINSRFIRIFIFHYLLSGIFFYFYLRTISIKKFSSIVGALLVTFSGYMIVGSSWGFSTHVFRAVFLLFAFEQLFVKKRWYFFPFAILYLSNNPFILFIYMLFLVLYALFRFYSTNQEPIIKLFKLAGKIVLLSIVGLLMNLVNIYYIFQKMFFSPRVSGNASYSQMLSGGEDIVDHANLGATTILRFFSSDLLGTGSDFQGWFNYFEAPIFYIGILTLLIFPQVFIHLTKRNKIVFGSFFGFWMLTLFFPILRHAMLAFTGDYFRFGFDFFIPFTLLFFAVYALNEIDKVFKVNFAVLGISFVGLLILMFFPYSSIPLKAIDNDLRISIVLIMLAYVGLIVLLSKPKFKTIAQIGILLLLVIELSYLSHKSYDERTAVIKSEFDQDKGGYNDGSIDAVNYIKEIDQTSFYRIEKDYQSGSAMHTSLNDALAQTYYGTTSYSSFNQLNYVRFLEESGFIQKGDETATRWISGLRGNPLIQTFANVKYNLSKSKRPMFLNFGFDSISNKNGVTILKNKYALPFGYTYNSYLEYEDFKKLTKFTITEQTLNTINNDLIRTININLVNTITTNLRPMLNIEYLDQDTFDDVVMKQLGVRENDQLILTVRKYSTVNFMNQLALLNAFVLEDDSNIDKTKFHKLEITDSTRLLPPDKFNFNIYQNAIDKLAEDTFTIKSFKHSEISGSLKLKESKLLFFTIPYDEGWKIQINGKQEQLSRVNLGFSGIALDEGEYDISIYYEAPYSKIIKIVSFTSIILFWLFIGYYIFRRKKKHITDQ